MRDQDNKDQIRNAVVSAINAKTAVRLQAGNSKQFYGNECSGEPLELNTHTGIVDYEPSELYITVRCGTPLREIESTLLQQNQMLPFEPPHFGENATIGGTIACGLAGPRRPYAGAVRDSVLGTHIINGKGEYLRFGGQVMKNVAGYDVARLMCGALGTLGIIMQVSLKVIPLPRAEITLRFDFNESEALAKMHQWAQMDLPITATYFEENNLYVRIDGIESTLRKVNQTLGGEELNDCKSFWHSVKEQERDFFNSSTPLWRLSVPSNAKLGDIADKSIIEWNGGIRWIKSNDSDSDIFAAASAVSGHATLFKSIDKPQDCFQPLKSKLSALHINVKRAFDPNNIINPGKMYSWC